eukprot:scaffold7657_cov109-Isochrysis_galbana.AAC.4
MASKHKQEHSRSASPTPGPLAGANEQRISPEAGPLPFPPSHAGHRVISASLAAVVGLHALRRHLLRLHRVVLSLPVVRAGRVLDSPLGLGSHGRLELLRVERRVAQALSRPVQRPLLQGRLAPVDQCRGGLPRHRRVCGRRRLECRRRHLARAPAGRARRVRVAQRGVVVGVAPPERSPVEIGAPDLHVVVAEHVLLLLGRRLQVLLPAVLVQDLVAPRVLQLGFLLPVDAVHHFHCSRVCVHLHVLPLVEGLQLVHLQRRKLGRVAAGALEVVPREAVLLPSPVPRQRVLPHRPRLRVVVGRAHVQIQQVLGRVLTDAQVADRALGATGGGLDVLPDTQLLRLRHPLFVGHLPVATCVRVGIGVCPRAVGPIRPLERALLLLLAAVPLLLLGGELAHLALLRRLAPGLGLPLVRADHGHVSRRVELLPVVPLASVIVRQLHRDLVRLYVLARVLGALLPRSLDAVLRGERGWAGELTGQLGARKVKKAGGRPAG